MSLELSRKAIDVLEYTGDRFIFYMAKEVDRRLMVKANARTFYFNWLKRRRKKE